MKVPYSEGSLFLVPLKSGGYARGVVARATNKGPALIGYFFGPRLASNIDVPRENLVPANAILCVRLGDLGLINGEWQIHGKVPNWKREEWPMPDFVRREPGKTKPVLVRYSDNFPLRVVKKYPVDDDSKLVRDMGWGDQAVQKRLSDILDGAEP